MNMKNLIAASLAALLVSATAAKAADIVHYQEPEVKSAFSWTGLYGGAQMGWGWADAKSKMKKDKAVLGKKSLSPEGVMGGIYAGYNYQFSDAIILGLDTDFVFSDLGDKKKVKALDGTLGARELWNGATRLRAGYTWDRFLPYVAAGVSYGSLRNSYSEGDDERSSRTKTRAGWNAGAGLDYAMTDHIILRGEYRFTDFGKDTSKIAPDEKYSKKWKQNDIRLGVAYKF